MGQTVLGSHRRIIMKGLIILAVVAAASAARRPHPCLQPQPHPQDHCRDRRHHREGTEDADQGRRFPMYKACKDSKDQGGFHDFVEILKLYDKNDDNTMLAHELFRLLTNLGEKLTKEEAKSLMKELCEPA